MTRRLRLITLCLIICLCPALLQALPVPDQRLPEFSIVTLSGEKVNKQSLLGHVLIIDFFASWCIPCRKSTPFLAELQNKFGRQGLQILGVSVDEGGETTTRNFASEHGINYPLALSDTKIEQAFKINSLPAMLIIDKRGLVSAVYGNFNQDVQRNAEQLIIKLLTSN